MSKFRFRLETLLRLRRASLDQQRARLAEAYRAEAILRERDAALVAEIESVQTERRSAVASGSVDVEIALAAQRCILVLQGQRQTLAEQASKLAEAIEQRRIAVVEADRDVKVLEKLRDRRVVEHRAGEDAREIKLLDEVAARTRREAV